MKSFAAVSSFVVAISVALPALSQQAYHYSYGGSRVVNQGQIGLYQPAATQIGPGTISRSAQGYQQQGNQINPGLPRVSLGSHVTTPGDVQYQTGFAPAQQPRVVTIPNIVGTAIVNNGLPAAPMGSHIGTAGDAMRSDLHPEVNIRNDQWWHPQVQQQSVQQYRYGGGYRPSGASGAATYDDGQASHGLTY